ncbi:IclR family transcriptional regulator [Variovorax sp. WS11]|uniref:IclR family transcriptional regulator n=1 Tax=Variovorax sp. WS11 TaxID=1105204 RepID=UPI000D0CC146|nr:IclR family transcriptional regulator [Variovorax sp. WS11]NDZ12761.1 IclR family transcriptional regulator [Variovorax sp. WS11]PSL84697.1 IclR family transcriptional regulator [Variovorax sp. WS11]
MKQDSARAQRKPIPSGKRAAAGEETAAVGSLSRGLQIVDVLTSAQNCLTLSEVAAQTGLDTSTTLRLLHSLSERGYVVRDDSKKRYLAGPRALSPLPLFHPLTTFRREAEPVLRSLVQRTGQTCALVIFVGNERLVVDFFRGNEPLSPYYDTWLRTPLHGTASGKLLLAWLPAAERELLIGTGPYEAHTEATITDPAILSAQLEIVFRQGHAVARGEAFPDFVAIAAPLMMPVHSRPMGCVIVSSTREMLPQKDEAESITSAKAAVALLMNTSPSLQVLKHWTARGERR